MTENLCAFQVANILDIAFFVAIIVFSFLGAKEGLIKTFFGFVSTVLAVILAFALASLVLEWTNGLFGLQGLIEKGVGDALCKVEVLSMDISKGGIENALADVSLPAFLKEAVVEIIANESVPEGTKLGMIVGDALGRFITILLCGGIVFLIIKLLMMLFSGIFSAIVNAWDVTRALNILFGALIGLIKGLLIISLILAVVSLIPSQELTQFFDQTFILRELFHDNPLNKLLALLIVG